MTEKTLAGIVAATLATVLTLIIAGTGTLLAASAASACGTTPASGTIPASGAALSGPAPGESPTTPPSAPSSQTVDCADAQLMLQRAATWLTAWNGGPVPYLSSTDPTTWLHGYRRDCSGYASMALGLPGPGLDTAALAARSTPITRTELLPGDLLINPAPDQAGHVVIFDQWTDTTMTTYLGYEQSGDGGTHHRAIPYPYFGGYPMSPYRFVSTGRPGST